MNNSDLVMFQDDFPRYHSNTILNLSRVIDLFVPALLLICLHFIFADQIWNKDYSWLMVLGSSIFFSSTQLLGGYSKFKERSISKKLEITFKSWGLNVFFLLIFSYLSLASSSFEREVMIPWVIITPLFIFLLKYNINKYDFNLNKDQVLVAVLGTSYQFTALEVDRLSKQNIMIKYFEINDLDAFEKDISLFVPNYLLFNFDKPINDDVLKRIVELDLDGIPAFNMSQFMESFLRKCYVSYNNQDLNIIHSTTAYNKLNFFLKRVIDIFSAIMLGSITLPIMLYAFIRIKLASPGPSIFSQDRVGVSGKEYTIYKFRSMHLDAEKDGAQFATQNDPRIFKFGLFIRKTRIDELPQLWNVIRGDLHFIGPRPERKIFTLQLEGSIPYYNERHVVSPGITGWAQVLYPYGSTTEDARQKLMYDLYYIKNWSIWLEFETLIRTIGVVLGRKGL